MSEIWIIGTDPPCPRCDLVTRRVKVVLGTMGVEIPVKHLSYEDPRASIFARSLGKRTGTAKDVAGESSISCNWEAITEIITRQWIKSAKRLGCSPEDVPAADRWSPELDEALKPFEDEAKRLGFLMTPVLVVNGSVRHQGSVPSMDRIESLLKELLVEQMPETALPAVENDDF